MCCRRGERGRDSDRRRKEILYVAVARLTDGSLESELSMKREREEEEKVQREGGRNRGGS